MPKVNWTPGTERIFAKMPLSDQAVITSEISRIEELDASAPELNKVVVLGPDKVIEIETPTVLLAFRKIGDGLEVLDLIHQLQLDRLKTAFHGRG